MAREIAPALNMAIIRFRQQSGHACGLIITVFQQQPAAPPQMLRCLADNGRDHFQAAGARHQGQVRFRPQVAEVWIVLRHIGRVGDDDVEALSGQGREPRAFMKRHIGEMQAFRIAARDIERTGTQVGGGDAALRALAGDGQGDGAAAGA
jgi:hypothetical protein